ncbi:hypothetical protein BGW80DRAFT_1466920 [Lactifluus volemus]|nr:hypothetical protein BGW80DRAFT_1466920 [Lactifluus volemus]
MHTHSDRYDALKKYIYNLEKQQREALLQAHDIDLAKEQTSLAHAAQFQDTDVIPTRFADMYKVAKLVSIYMFGYVSSTLSTHSRDVTASRTRRISISSTEENIDLEASLPPFCVLHSFPTPVPEREEPGPEASVSLNDPRNGGSLGRSRSPTIVVFGVANKLRSSIASLELRDGYTTAIQPSNLYVQVSALRSYVELNYSGFRKVLKKYDKVTESSLQTHYLHDILEPTLPFDQVSRARPADAQSALVQLYAKCVMQDDTAGAQRFLKLNLREHVAWERNTVWRQMIGRERRGQGGTPLGAPVDTTEEKAFETVDEEEANQCFAVLVFATDSWVTEAISLFVTSTMVPALLIWLRVIRDADTNERLSPVEATRRV